MDTQWIAIARTGTFTDTAGMPHTFTAADLDTIAASYNPTTLEAPLVFGHPATNAPAYGWVKALKRQGEKLFASFAQVPDAVRQLVAQGQYKYVSMSLMPDRKRLRHVGLLGAAVPAIEGLGAVELANGAEGICITFAAQDTATALVASNSASRTGRADAHHIKGVSMPTPEELQQQIGALQQQLESLKSENAELKKKLEESGATADGAKKDAETTAAEFAAYKNGVETTTRKERVAALVAAGKVAPAEQEGVLSFAATLAQVATPVDFSAPDGIKHSLRAEERYFRELEARPVDGRFADFAAHAPAPAHAVVSQARYSAVDMANKL